MGLLTSLIIHELAKFYKSYTFIIWISFQLSSLSLFSFPNVVTSLETKYPKCCNLISEYSSCQKACEQVSLSLPKETRSQKLTNVQALCPEKKEFWDCMKSVINATDQAYGWLGWPCCNIALSQNCFLSCVTSTSTAQIHKTCRPSDEITFYQCMEKQEEGEICCSNTSNEECRQACWRIFKKESSPSQDDKLYVQRKCGYSNEHVLRCIQNYTKTTPARNPAENLKCCQESSNVTCRERCKEILLNSTTEQEIVDKLIENCGQALPNNALWQCFIRNSEVNTNDQQASSLNTVLTDFKSIDDDEDDDHEDQLEGMDIGMEEEFAGRRNNKIMTDLNIISNHKGNVQQQKHPAQYHFNNKIDTMDGGIRHSDALYGPKIPGQGKQHPNSQIIGGNKKSLYAADFDLMSNEDIMDSNADYDTLSDSYDTIDSQGFASIDLHDGTGPSPGQGSYKQHHYHPTSKLDIAGLDAVKLQCCSKAVTQTCIDLCTKSYSLEANNNWNDFSEHCQYNPVETNLITCLSEVDEPCSLGCPTSLPFCGHLFNRRPLDLFRSCKTGADISARELITNWFTDSTISLPALDIPVLNIRECSPDQWIAIACVLEIKPCHPMTHTSLICRNDCLQILNKCVNRQKLLPGQTPEGLCNILSPVDPDQSCISVAYYMNGSKPLRQSPDYHQKHGAAGYPHNDLVISNTIFGDPNRQINNLEAPAQPLTVLTSMPGDVRPPPLATMSFQTYFSRLITRKTLNPCIKIKKSLTDDSSVCPRESVCVIDRTYTCASSNEALNFGLHFKSECFENPQTLRFGQPNGNSKIQRKQRSFKPYSRGRKNRGIVFETRKNRDPRADFVKESATPKTSLSDESRGFQCLPGCTLGEVSSYTVPHGSFVQLPINGKGLTCHRVCQCSAFSLPLTTSQSSEYTPTILHKVTAGNRKWMKSMNELLRCHSIPCYGVSHCWIQDSVKMHLSQFTMDCNDCVCHNGKVICTSRACPLSLLPPYWGDPSDSLPKNSGHQRLFDHPTSTLSDGYPLPCNCPQHYVPVCATNGKTYPSGCLAKCAGITDDSFEYGACPSAGSPQLASVCAPLNAEGAQPYNPCSGDYGLVYNYDGAAGAGQSPKVVYERKICVPLRQVCLSSAIDNLKSASAKRTRSPNYDPNSAKYIPVSTCPQNICVNRNLMCSSKHSNTPSPETCSLFRNQDYRLFLPNTPTDSKRCLKRLSIRSDTHLKSLLFNLNYAEFVAGMNIYRMAITTANVAPSIYNDDQIKPNKLDNSKTKSVLESQDFIDVTGILPVCGYDGETYVDECQAALNGALIDYYGPCVTTGILGVRSSSPFTDPHLAHSDILTSDNNDFYNSGPSHYESIMEQEGETSYGTINRNSHCPASSLLPGGQIVCDETKNRVILFDESDWATRYNKYYKHVTNRGPADDEVMNEGGDYAERSSGDSKLKKFTVTCNGIVPPGACCPVCAAEIRVLYSTDTANLFARETELGPVTINQITAKLRRHLRVPECDIYGYMSIERDLVFLVAPTLNGLLRDGPYNEEFSSIQDIPKLRFHLKEYLSDSLDGEDNAGPHIFDKDPQTHGDHPTLGGKAKSKQDSNPFNRDDTYTFYKNILKNKKYFNTYGSSSPYLYLWSRHLNLNSDDDTKINSKNVKNGSNNDSSSLHRTKTTKSETQAENFKDKFFALPVTPFPTSPLHIEICNKETKRLAALINAQSPTLFSELPMSVLLGARVRTSYAKVTVTSGATTTYTRNFFIRFKPNNAKFIFNMDNPYFTMYCFLKTLELTTIALFAAITLLFKYNTISMFL